jgi:hypothetical protein
VLAAYPEAHLWISVLICVLNFLSTDELPGEHRFSQMSLFKRAAKILSSLSCTVSTATSFSPCFVKRSKPLMFRVATDTPWDIAAAASSCVVKQTRGGFRMVTREINHALLQHREDQDIRITKWSLETIFWQSSQ